MTEHAESMIESSDAPTGRGRTSRLATQYKDALDFAESQVRRLVTEYPDRTPVFTEGGRWSLSDDAWAPAWTGGFLAGMMWIFAERTGSSFWRTQAERYSRLLEPRNSDRGTHDLGFLFMPSWGRWHQVEATEETKSALIEAGRTMALRFETPGSYLCTWIDRSSTLIDVMMNVSIVLEAGRLDGDDALTAVAIEHSSTTRKYLVRGDGSTAHEGWFHPQTGEFLNTATHQGWRGDSSWARGQAWAIYGFTEVYALTQDDRFLETAQRCADFYIDRTASHGVPPNDWDEPTPPVEFESSAGSVAAAGMLRLSARTPDRDRASGYWRYAKTILDSLSSPSFLAVDDPDYEGIVKHAIYHYRNGLGVDESVMWGDYYFVEALRLLELSGDGLVESP